ncbi:MAG: hypothetical protein HFE33_05210 [Clostridia bacterium]|nr:hypothetical protein [Clostridia bacterium]
MNILDKKAFYEAEDSLMRLEQAKDLSLLICRKVNDAISSKNMFEYNNHCKDLQILNEVLFDKISNELEKLSNILAF